MKIKILPITGDASSRIFSRIILKKENKIIVYAKNDKYKNLAAYTAVNKFLRNNKVLAPKLVAHNYEKGIIVIEDFGDLTFHKILLKSKNKIKVYKNLVDLLLKIQKIKPKLRIKNIINTSHYFKNYSNKELHKESDLFFKWYLSSILDKKKKKKNWKKSKKNFINSIQPIKFP